MVFNAVIYHIDQLIVFKLLSSDGTDLPHPKDYFISPYGLEGGPFFIKRVNTFEVNGEGIYLPGDSDYNNTVFPRYTYLSLGSKANLLRWLIKYTEAYSLINNELPLIFDMENIGMDLEDVPESRLA